MAARLLRVLAACGLLACGCGATTVRVELAPVVDSQGRGGFESTVGLGVGLPLDYGGRSRHYIQARASAGGGVDSASRAPMFTSALDADYLYWAGRLDLRAGLRLSYRSTADTKLYGLGARLGISPVVWGDESGWLVSHVCVGPELRVESLWSDPGGASRALFSAPLVVEANFLGAGD